MCAAHLSLHSLPFVSKEVSLTYLYDSVLVFLDDKKTHILYNFIEHLILDNSSAEILLSVNVIALEPINHSRELKDGSAIYNYSNRKKW